MHPGHVHELCRPAGKADLGGDLPRAGIPSFVEPSTIPLGLYFVVFQPNKQAGPPPAVSFATVYFEVAIYWRLIAD